LDGAQKAAWSKAALCDTAQGRGSGPRTCRASLGHGGSCIPAVMVRMVRGVVLLFAPDLEKSEQNPSQSEPPVGNALRHYLQISNRSTAHGEWLQRAGMHPSCMGEPEISSPRPMPGN